MQRLTGFLRRVPRAAQVRAMGITSTMEEIRNREHDIDKYLYLRDMQRCGAENLGRIQYQNGSWGHPCICRTEYHYKSILLWISCCNTSDNFCADNESPISTLCSFSTQRKSFHMFTHLLWGRLASGTIIFQSCHRACILNQAQKAISWSKCKPGRNKMSGLRKHASPRGISACARGKYLITFASQCRVGHF